MSAQLHIGTVAKLLGISQKAIRHYHKVGLLNEPPRSANGYRLYTASDLVRLQRIRHLQTLGLSLQQIKTLLGEHVAGQERTFREVLQVLHEELTRQIQRLEAQRARITALLAEDAIEIKAPATRSSSTLEFFQQQLGDQLSGVSEQLVAMDMQIFSQLDAFNWPENYDAGLNVMLEYVREHPTFYQGMIMLAERLAALGNLTEDAPEVDQLIEEYASSAEMQAFMAMQAELATLVPQMASPFADVLAELTAETLSPAQQRFLTTVQQKLDKPKG